MIIVSFSCVLEGVAGVGVGVGDVVGVGVAGMIGVVGVLGMVRLFLCFCLVAMCERMSMN